MFRILTYLLKQGVATMDGAVCPPLEQTSRGLPHLTNAPCLGTECNACVNVCPTDAIEVGNNQNQPAVKLDLGACIACGMCTNVCTTETIVENLSTQVARKTRSELVLRNQDRAGQTDETENKPGIESNSILTASKLSDRIRSAFKRSVAIRVVSTGCSACDLEIGASSNPVFDVERFGVQIVASPRAADILMVTGPVAKGMQTAVLRCYEAMPDPRIVIAAGTCAISGGVHKGGYSDANGLDSILPVDVYIPGCPPHPWSLIHGVITARGQSDNKPQFVGKNRLQTTQVS